MARPCYEAASFPISEFQQVPLKKRCGLAARKEQANVESIAVLEPDQDGFRSDLAAVWYKFRNLDRFDLG